MGIQVSAISALNRLRAIIFADQKSLHFAQLERAQDAAQSGDAPAVALRLTERFADQTVAALIKGFALDAAHLFANLLFIDVAYLGRKASQQPLPHVGMQVGLEFMPMVVVASDDQIVKDFLLEHILQVGSDVFEVVQDLIADTAFGVARVVSRETIAAAAMRQFVEKRLVFFEFIETDVEETGPVAIDQGQPQAGLRAQQKSQRLEMEPSIGEELGAGKLRGQVKFTPDAAVAASEYGLGTCLATAKVADQVEDLAEIGTHASVFPVLFGCAQGSAHQIFGQDRLFAVRPVPGSLRLKVKTEGALRALCLKLSQLTKLFASNHPRFLLRLVGSGAVERPLVEAAGERRGAPQVFAHGGNG